jgi:hypothetical protein
VEVHPQQGRRHARVLRVRLRHDGAYHGLHLRAHVVVEVQLQSWDPPPPPPCPLGTGWPEQSMEDSTACTAAARPLPPLLHCRRAIYLLLLLYLAYSFFSKLYTSQRNHFLSSSRIQITFVWSFFPRARNTPVVARRAVHGDGASQTASSAVMHDDISAKVQIIKIRSGTDGNNQWRMTPPC